MDRIHRPVLQPRRYRRRLADAAAFTLPEVAVAAFVLVFAIASSVIGIQIGYKSIDLARGLTLASQVLQSEVENIRLLAWPDIEAMSEDEEDIVIDESTPAGRELKRRFSSITRQAGPLDAASSHRRITIRVSWVTPTDGRTHTRETFTLYARDGLNDFFTTNPDRS
jgi:hypothetical protein